MSSFQDQTIKCKYFHKCGNDIRYTAAQQLVHQQKGWSPPKQCRACKDNTTGGAGQAHCNELQTDAVVPASSYKVLRSASGSVTQVATSTSNASSRSGVNAGGGGGGAVAVAVAAPTSASPSVPAPPAPWTIRDAEHKSAGFVYGRLERLLPLLERWYPDHRDNRNGDDLTAIVAIRLGSIESFLVQGRGHYPDFAKTGRFPLRRSGDIYMKAEGNIQVLEAGTIISPSAFTTTSGIHEPSAFTAVSTRTGSGRLYCDELRRLGQDHPECYILGVMYKEGDIQPFVSETAKHADESPTDILFRGLQEELQMTLSDARRGELAGSFQGPYGFKRDKTTGLATKVIHVVDIRILDGLGADYTIHIDDSQVLPDPADAVQTQNAAATTQDIQAIVSQTARLSVDDVNIARGGKAAPVPASSPAADRVVSADTAEDSENARVQSA